MTCQGQSYYGEARVKAFHVPKLRSSSFEILNCLDGNHREEMMKAVRTGMEQPQKAIPSKYFYDAHGSRLFERICCTPEYYPTRTELSILDRYAPEIMTFLLNGGGDLVELGSGSNRKVRKLLDTLRPSDLGKIRYVPVDISKSCIEESSKDLLRTYKSLPILGIAADFTRHLDMLPKGRKLILFLGSTIGNFGKKECLRFLRSVKEILNPEDRFLLGIDMIKPVDVIEKAYNDGEGITRLFNLNILAHINRELNADFNPEHFEHVAFFNGREERVEMHLRAERPHTVRISELSLSVDFKEGETLHTEICRKFSPESAQNHFKKAGLAVTKWFTDPDEWFSLVELRAEGLV